MLFTKIISIIFLPPKCSENVGEINPRVVLLAKNPHPPSTFNQLPRKEVKRG